MGRTSFSGPVYGARQNLIQMYRDTLGLSSTDFELFQYTLPADEDWYVDRVHTYCDEAGTVATTIDVEDDTVSILTGAITLSSDTEALGTLAATPTRIAAGSVITIDGTSGATTSPSDMMVTLEGWRRFIGAPRGRTNPLS